MVCPITRPESYVCETGKVNEAVAFQRHADLLNPHE